MHLHKIIHLLFPNYLAVFKKIMLYLGFSFLNSQISIFIACSVLTHNGSSMLVYLNVFIQKHVSQKTSSHCGLVTVWLKLNLTTVWPTSSVKSLRFPTGTGFHIAFPIVYYIFAYFGKVKNFTKNSMSGVPIPNNFLYKYKNVGIL